MERLLNSELFPAVEKIAESGSIIPYKIVTRENAMIHFWEKGTSRIPYLRDLLEGVSKCRSMPTNVVIVTKSEPIAAKCAKFLLDNETALQKEFCFHDSEVQEDDPYGIYDDEDDYFYEDTPEEGDLKTISLPKGTTVKEMPVNLYIKLLEEVVAQGVLYEGLGSVSGEIQDMVDAILADNKYRKYIWITPDMVNAPWVTNLRMQHGFEMIQIRDVPMSYYEEVFRSLLTGARYSLEDSLRIPDLVNRISKLRGGNFSEEDIDWMIQKAIHHSSLSEEFTLTLTQEDFALNGKVEATALERLEAMPGLEEVKEMVYEQTALLKEARRNDQLGELHGNMIFYGNPGTGKTTSARLLAEIMADNGVTNTTFTEASRSDIIGQFVGTTATKVAALFEKARGGVLFVDEAGFFLNSEAGGYVNEALKEFVRFMENYPDVTVIFGMYESEAENFLKLDAGLSSRISRMVEFRDYSTKEMQDIFHHMAKTQGYSLENGAWSPVMEYINALKKEKTFGNARELRKVIESSIVAHSVRLSKNKAAKADVLTVSDVNRGIERLRKNPRTKKEFGFRYTTIGNNAVTL